MSDDLKAGDSVTWTSSGGKSKGRVKKKLTAPLEIKGHHVAASPSNPEYLVESETGGRAAHKPGSLKKTPAKNTSAKVSATETSGSSASTHETAAAKSSAKKSSAKASSSKKPAAKRATAKKASPKKN